MVETAVNSVCDFVLSLHNLPIRGYDGLIRLNVTPDDTSKNMLLVFDFARTTTLEECPCVVLL